MDSSSSSPKSPSSKPCSPKSFSSSSSSSSSKSYSPTVDSEGVLTPLIHKHRLMYVQASRSKKKCDYQHCDWIRFNIDSYECEDCDYFIHKSCAESFITIQDPYHPGHTLQLQHQDPHMMRLCDFCGERIEGMLLYHCEICEFNIHQSCATRLPPPEVIDISDAHHHKLTFLKDEIEFNCAACGGDNNYSIGSPYKCLECDLAFHVECVWRPFEAELKHPHHLLHPLKSTPDFPTYSDPRCTLCGNLGLYQAFHCSPCNFTLCQGCVVNPPSKSLLNLKAHDHKLTLLPRVDTFTCNACGLKGDRSPYACFQCGFMIHQDCLDLPRIININRHDHRVSRSSVLGFVNPVCGICRKKMDRSRGGFSSEKCRGYVVHSQCATREDVWNGEELEGVPEETENVEPYLIIDDNTIQHFSHEEHPLKLHVNEVLCDDNKRCRACTHPICLQSFYACDVCDFILHQNCAGFLRKKRHFLHNDRLTLVRDEVNDFYCNACCRLSNGFRYEDGEVKLDVLCASICEPFVHPSHRGHPLYYTSPDESNDLCDACNLESEGAVLRCIEDDCEYVLCFKCATLPLVIKHRVDDHLLSLCYGENAIGKYWCDICEKETDPKKWFYTCKDQRATLHTKCVFGDFTNLMPGKSEDCGAMVNNSVSRPICIKCKLHCIYPILLIDLENNEYYCSWDCWDWYCSK